MDMSQRFDVRLDRDAAKEYERLKNPTLTIVTKSIDELMYRADEVGKPLGNKREMKLTGCKEIKLREAGIRIIFRITDTVVEILQVVQVITIEKRSRDMAFKIAASRLKHIKQQSNPKELLRNSTRWRHNVIQKEKPNNSPLK